MNSGSLASARQSAEVADDSLQVRGINVHFGGLVALDDVSLTARARQVTGIIGPNGAGKTTLLNVLCGFVRPQSGSMSFAGRELNRLAIEIYRDCTEAGVWPGYSDEIELISLPAWARPPREDW